MNENNNNNTNNSNVTPYRASGNLNTVIGNPSVNINNTMAVNIQSASTGSKSSVPSATNVVNSNGIQIPTNAYQAPKSHTAVPNAEAGQTQMVNNNVNNMQNNVPQGNSQFVQRTYVGNNGTPKKKKIQFNMGPEFKLVILIIVILLVFIFVLPIITGF